MSIVRSVVSFVLVLAAIAVAPQVARAERVRGEVHGSPAVEALSLAKTTCTADCGAMPIVTVRCPGSCVAYDRSCPYQRGYVQCNGGAKVYCEEPCACSAETSCPEGGSVYCTGTDGECFGGDGLCYVECNGQIEFCPGHEGEELCEVGDPW